MKNSMIVLSLLIGACGGVEPPLEPLDSGPTTKVCSKLEYYNDWCGGAFDCVEVPPAIQTDLVKCWNCACPGTSVAYHTCHALTSPTDIAGKPCGQSSWRDQDGNVCILKYKLACW